MIVKRIVATIATAEPGLAQAFYGDLFGLTLVMDHGWIQTYAAEAVVAAPQPELRQRRRFRCAGA